MLFEAKARNGKSYVSVGVSGVVVVVVVVAAARNGVTTNVKR